MRLVTLKRHWDRLGQRDPFRAVLTDRETSAGEEDVDAFFRSGVDELAAVLQRAERLGLMVSRRRALDFGCGVGRVTQAMAVEFERCDGVDISSSMLRVARRYNRHPGRCFYHLNVASDLSRFADASFGFIYSTLVLQHIEPATSTGYVRELLRVLTPGGLLVFQLPSHRAALEPSTTAPRTPISGRLPADAFKARLTAGQSSLSARAGEPMTLRVTVANQSPRVWPALPDAWRLSQINLANHWLHENGHVLQRDDARCPLPHDLPPGSQADLMLGVRAPLVDGTYWLEIDLVEENVGWFAPRGSEALRIPCEVTGGLPSAHPADPDPADSDPEIVAPEPGPPFRERHPHAFRVLRATRLRDVYWRSRYALDALKARRDRIIQRVAPPLVNWWKGRPFAARMEMYCVPRSEVLMIIADGGGRVVHAEEELVPGGFQSYRYWVVKA